MLKKCYVLYALQIYIHICMYINRNSHETEIIKKYKNWIAFILIWKTVIGSRDFVFLLCFPFFVQFHSILLWILLQTIKIWITITYWWACDENKLFGTCKRILSPRRWKATTMMVLVDGEVQHRNVWKKIKYKSSAPLLIKFEPKDVLYSPLAGIKNIIWKKIYE